MGDPLIYSNCFICREWILKEQREWVLANRDIQKNYKMCEDANDELVSEDKLHIINSPELRIEPLKENAGELLKEIVSRLDKPYWISAGTALGLYRDGDLIKGDTDLDFAMLVPCQLN